MMSYQITTAIIGFILAGSILYLVRRDHLHGSYALWWLGVAGFAIVLGAFPRVIDAVAYYTGISYPPNLLFALVIGMLLIKMLRSDIESSRHERRIRRLGQKLAILAEENQRLQEEIAADQPREQRRAGNQ
ncbi:MAG: DUF2304 domain-containing protein [Pseudomonadota bacterium]